MFVQLIKVQKDCVDTLKNYEISRIFNFQLLFMRIHIYASTQENGNNTLSYIRIHMPVVASCMCKRMPEALLLTHIMHPWRTAHSFPPAAGEL